VWVKQQPDGGSALTEAILFCPKCRAEMASYQHGEITIAQCGFCRGVFVTEQSLFRLLDSSVFDLEYPLVTPQYNGYSHSSYEGRHRRD